MGIKRDKVKHKYGEKKELKLEGKNIVERVCQHLVIGCLVEFYGLSMIVGYLMPNPFFIHKQFYFKPFSLV